MIKNYAIVADKNNLFERDSLWKDAENLPVRLNSY